MKLGHKLTLALLCVLALVLGLCTLWTQDRQWERALQDARSAALANWQREADALQKGLRPDDQYSNYNQELYSRAWRYLMQPGAPRAALAVYGQDGTMLASSMPVTLAQTELARAVPGDADLQLLTAVAADGTRYFLCSGLVLLPEECVTLVSAQSLDGLFADRALRLRDAVLTQAAALAVAALLTLLFCRRMMRPLERLEAASRQIAAGAYDRRTALPGSDEIAGLSRSFDAMAAAVQEKVNDLQRHLQARDAFVAAFTHELKTPMTSMLGYADLLRGAEVPTATRRKAADFIYHESKRLEALSGRLMELMQLEHETPPALGPVRLDAVFRQTGRALPEGAPTPVFAACRTVVLAQRELLCDLLYNLLQNARRATPADGTVAVEVHEEADHVTLTVRDTGCGIPAGDLPHVTEPFYMVDKSRARNQGGSGMGLALCARIAELHGTRLELESRPGAGTRVHFTLQKAKEDGHEAA